MIDVDVSNPDLFVAYELKILPPGKHLFEVGNNVEVVPCASPSENSKFVVEAICQDEDENKGTKVFDNFVLIKNPTTDGHQKAIKINQGRLCQLAVACGVRTKEDIMGGKGVSLEELKGCTFEAITKIVSYIDKQGQSKQKAEIVKYLFEVS